MQIHTLLQDNANTMSLEENIDDSGLTISEDYEANDDDVTELALTLPVGSKSQVTF